MRRIILCLILIVGSTWSLSAFAAQSPYSGSPVSVPGQIQAEAYDRGGEGVAYHDTSPGNVFGVFRTDSMDVGAIPGGGYHLGFIKPGEWAEYTISVPRTGDYILDMRLATAYTGLNRFRVLDNGVDVSNTQTLGYTGGWHSYVTKSVPVTLTAGTRVLRLSFEVGEWNLDWINVRGQSPFGATPITFPGRLKAELFDRGGEGLAYHDTTPGNVFNQFRSDDMDVGVRPDGGYHIGNIDTGEWVEYTIDIAQSGSYELRMVYSTAFTGLSTFRVLVDGQVQGGTQSLAGTGDWFAYQIKVIPVTLSAGSGKTLRLAFDTGVWNLAFIDAVMVSCSPPQITQQPISQTVVVGSNVSFSAGASGSPAPSLQWLRNGIPIAGQTSGTLTLSNVQTSAAGSYSLRASNSCGQVTSSAALLTVSPPPTPPSCAEDPGKLEQALADVLAGRPASCNWVANMKPSFPNSMTNGASYNKPVLAAAIALIVEPIRSTGSKRWNAYTWWDQYLKGELGQRGNNWKYGGQELTSGNYQFYNIAAVMAVHHQANLLNRSGLRAQARAWLRATFAIHAMAATTSKPISIHDRGSNENFGRHYTGPFVALPGMRSSENHWANLNRSILFARAGEFGSNLKAEAPYQKSLRTFLEARWNGPGGSIYGLNSTDRAALRAVVNNGALGSRVTGMLSGIHPIRTLRFAGWPGVRATVMEGNVHHGTAPTYGMAWFSAPRAAAGRELHVLYPWKRQVKGSKFRPFRHGCPGTGFAGGGVMVLPKRTISATNNGGCSAHPASSPSISGLPPGTPQFSYTLN